MGGIGVSIFLLLSGYGLNESWNHHESPWKCWWRKRFIAVWIPYILIQCIAYWPFREFAFIPFLLDLSLINPLYTNGWYLQYLFLWYVIFYVIRRVKVLDQNRLPKFTILSIAMFFFLGELQAEQSLSFLAGVLLSENKEAMREKFSAKNGIMILSIGLFFLALKQLPATRIAPEIVMKLVQLMIKLPCGFGFIILAHKVSEKLSLKWFGWIGVISYELYLIHGYVLDRVSINGVGAVLFVAITGTLSLEFSFLLNKLNHYEKKILRLK